MDYFKILKGVLSTTLKLDDGKIDEILKEKDGVTEATVQSQIETLDAARVETLKAPKKGETYQDGYATAKKEVLTDLEKSLKTTHGIESDKKGVDLIDEIISTKTQPGKTDLTDDAVKKHPVFVQMEKDFKTKLTDKEKELETKTNEYDGKIKKVQTFASVKNDADAIFQALKPVVAKNPTVANNIKKQFLAELEGFEYEKQADGSYIVSKDGKRVEDKHGHARDFNDIVKSIAGDYYEFEANNGGSSAGNDNDKDKTKPDINNVKSEEDALKLAVDGSISLEDRIKMLDDMEKTGG